MTRLEASVAAIYGQVGGYDNLWPDWDPLWPRQAMVMLEATVATTSYGQVGVNCGHDKLGPDWGTL